MVQFQSAYGDNYNVYIVMELCRGDNLLERTLTKKHQRYAEGGSNSNCETNAKHHFSVIHTMRFIEILNLRIFCFDHLAKIQH